jgi:LAO/AO transport system kinase
LSDELGLLLGTEKARDFKLLAKLLTYIETHGPEVLESKPLLNPSSFALRIGITGPPGAGKSTLISELISGFRQQNKKVGVLAVDPSSPFTRGAVLGDRIRYQKHFNDGDVFIRSVGSRGSLGGLSASTYLMARAFDVFEFNVLLIETVGVGQTELEIMNVADRICVVVVPEFGDSIQAMKAGILEIANVFAVNKSDREGATKLARELETWANKPVIETVATEGKGVSELMKLLSQVETESLPKLRREPKRLQAEALALVRMQIEKQTENRIRSIHSNEDLLRVIKSLNL